jgi:hypothetical protein
MKTTTLAGDYILNCYELCIATTIVFLMFIINPFIIPAMSTQYASASLICVDYSNDIAVAKINNCKSLNSDFHRVDLFSELSRNMTPSSSSSSLFEDAENTGKEDVESNAEADDLQDETTTGQVDESLSSSSPSSRPNLFEGTNDVESNADDNKKGQDVITSEESPESNDNDDNTIDSQLTNNK